MSSFRWLHWSTEYQISLSHTSAAPAQTVPAAGGSGLSTLWVLLNQHRASPALRHDGVHRAAFGGREGLTAQRIKGYLIQLWPSFTLRWWFQRWPYCWGCQKMFFIQHETWHQRHWKKRLSIYESMTSSAKHKLIFWLFRAEIC